MKYYSAIKRNEVLTHATICMNLENVTSEKKKLVTKENYILCNSIYIKWSE